MSILTTHSYIIPIVVLFLCFLIKIPISYSLFSASIVYCMFMGLDLGTICEKTMSTLYFKYVILAVPLFIFTANVLNSSKVSDYIFGFCKALIGKRKGALAYVNVLISLIFSFRFLLISFISPASFFFHFACFFFLSFRLLLFSLIYLISLNRRISHSFKKENLK